MRTRRVVVTLVVLIGACTSGEEQSDPSDATSTNPSATAPASSPTGEASPSAGADVLEGSFDVGGHELYMHCSGTGSPTVVYLHGYIPDPSFSGSSSALTIQDLIDEDHRMCIYDRANVGLSDSVEGPLTGKTSVRDLHLLLAAAGVESPYVFSPPRSAA